ncbi:LacI family DNA-binding transcriptional regulator [Oerskovia enterophila]|uniref:LacI family DNA-binding transcriptional regulator n=1 Tax=Oerskovia enterophila TaxID=43678 RepID=UPI00339AE501
MAKKPSLKSVAQAAGVSPSTVSNAYNRPEQMSAQVREHVLDVAARLGYPGPDASASSLRSGRTGSVGVLFAQDLTYAFSDPYCLELLTGIADVATRTSMNMLLMPVGPHLASGAYSRQEELDLVQNVRRAVLDGAIADGVDPTHPVLQVLTARGVPVVSTVADVGDRCVLVDDHAAAVEVGAHLAALGHRRVAVVADSLDDGAPLAAADDAPHLFPYSRLRIAGFRAGLGPGHELTTVSAGQNTRTSGSRAAAMVLASGPRPTAILTTSDVLALGVIDTLRSEGVTVGREMSVTGFDDIPEAREVGLTTVRQPVREKGRLMVEMLRDPDGAGTSVTLRTELVVRASTGPAVPRWPQTEKEL